MKIPKFASEDEEAQWWYDNREQLDNEFEQALKEGKSVSGKNLTATQRIEALRSKAVHIDLSEGDLKIAQQLAESRGVPYRTYIKSLLHDALVRESQAKAS